LSSGLTFGDGRLWRPTALRLRNQRCHTIARRATAEFATALLDPRRRTPPGLIGPDGNPNSKRFNVYRNNVVAGLVATLRDAYPAVACIVGDEFFAAMARVYVAETPPTSPIMLDYGAGFPDFIGTFEPGECLPYLQDIARIERAWIEAYHAVEAEPLASAVFTRIASDDLPNLRLALHPSLRLVGSRFPSLTIWRMNIKGGEPERVDLDAGGDDILVIRPNAEVEMRSLPVGGAEFIQALGEGLSVIEATKSAMAADYRFDLSANLSGLIGARFRGGRSRSRPAVAQNRKERMTSRAISAVPGLMH
jgi:hypothetical protein